MDIETLLQDRSGDQPSGENLEYDPDFVAMELAAETKDEQQMGDDVIAAVDPDFSAVKSNALSLLERSHDLRVALRLAEAELRTVGLSAFAEVAVYVKRCLEERWDTCHPELDADDNDDPTMRVNAVMSLVDQNGLLKSLRMAPLANSRAFGQFSHRDIEIASGVRAAPSDMEVVPSMDAIRAGFQDSDADELAELQVQLNSCRESINAIDAVFDEKTPGVGPDLTPIKSVLNEQIKMIAEHSGVAMADEGEPEAMDNDDAPVAAVSAGTVGGINTPNDVINALDRIMDYYARNEPSSPLPILLQRAKKLVNADFMTIVKDMAPSGIDNVNVIGGIESEDGY